MLLKYSQSEKRSKINGNSRQQRSTGNMKLLAGSTTLNARLPRKTVKGFAAKRPSSHLRPLPVSGREEHRTPIDASDNSNDSGLGFDQHLDVTGTVHAVLRLSDREPIWDNGHSEAKRKKLDIKLESDDANDNFSFSHAMSKSHKATSQPGGLECLMPSRGSAGASGMQRPLGGANSNGSAGAGGGAGGVQRGSLGRLPPRPVSVSARRPPGPVSLSSPLMGQSRDGRVQLQIASQPEQQHRARYQTEGSRGAVKDRSGNGFPVVKLTGYNKPATLQVFIGTDMGRVAPHMFYQACKVSGKNSTPCVEKKIDGTIVIEVDFDPAKDMTITCDCVGILKERNVDVEHRFPDQSGTRNKKKSTRCRMVFRTTITHPDGSSEILQTSSQPIVCTQPPGVPEICKKSLSTASCTGGMELFILGKNFLKDTRVVFQQSDIEPPWEETVQPDKEFLQQTHLVCIVPAYQRCDILEPVTVRLLVTSSGKTSEPHSFTYMPAPNPVLQPAVGTSDIPQTCLNLVSSGVPHGCIDLNRVFNKPPLGPPSGLILPGTPTKPPPAMLPGLPNQFLPVDPPPARVKKDVHPIRLWTSMPLVGDPVKAEGLKARDNEQSKIHGLKMMPPPPPLLPIARGSSSNVLIIPDIEPDLKTEVLDESSQESVQLSPEELKGIDLRMKPTASVGPIATVSDLLSTQSPSLATFRRFVSNPSDAPLPTQSGQSVEKYLSHIENPVAPKAGDSGGGSGAGGGSNSSGGSASASATITATAIAVPSAAPTASPTDSAAQELAMNKMCNADTTINSQFNNPIMFGPSQATNSGLLAPSLPPTVSETQKISFGNDITLPTIYSSASSVVEKEQKPQLVEQATLQDTMASRLLAVGLNTVVPASQAKSKYQENPLPSLCSAQSLPSALLPTVTNATLPDFTASGPNSSEASSLSVPTLLGSIGSSSTIIENGTSLIFNNTQQQDHKSLLSSAEVSQKADEQLIDSNKISNHSSSSSPSSTVGVIGSSHNMLSSSGSSSDNPTLNISAQSGTIAGNLLAATQAESAIMSGTSDTRLDALVSSAIESRILEANCQNQAAEKLDVFSSTQSIIQAVTTDNAVLGAQTQVPLSDSLGTNQNTSSSPIHCQEMSLNSSLTVPSVNTFPLNTLSPSQTTAQITQENIILNNTLTSAFSTHLLNTDSNAKATDITLSPVRESNLTLEPVASAEASHIVLSNPACAPPIAMKSIIMSSANSSVENSLLNSGTIQSPQISGKNIVNSSTIGSSNISNVTHTSPVAMKTMILADKATVMTTAMDVKDILAPTTAKEEITLAAGTAHCTSPIAMKKIILESASVVDQALGVKSILNSQPSDNLLASTVPHVTLSSDKLDALVESTMSKHVLTSPVQTTTSGMSIDGTAVCSSTNSLPLTTQSLATILGSNMPSNLPNSTSLPGTSSTLLPESETRELHNSTGVSPIENSNVALTSPQTLQSGSPGILSSQSPSVSGTSLMTMFSSENESSTKSQTLESVPSVSTTCSSLLNHHLGMFGPQPNVTVHTLLSSNQSSTDAQTLSHTIPFTSTNSNTSGLMSTAPCTVSKLGKVSSTAVQEGQAQARLLNEAFMVLANGDNRKNQIDVIVTQDNKVNKEVVTSVNCKIAEGSSVQSCSSAVTKLDVQAVHMQQQQQKIMAQQQNLPDQEKQGEKTLIVTNASLSVPVTDISSVRQTAKDSVAAVAAPAPKKLEEGMVPQELTQMSESDLLSYINPSCFDQV
ncbi:hypothetical protein R5R35_009287 [Gryllus longicercus]|uniref:Nuclear factor of activated T-cells 5 n=1 Tax=Gryllus longicercus TaxID=2509291 RepID=A0AAN9WBT9_9ORTH